MSVPPVRVGQIWLDCDKRMFGRKLIVESITDGVATCRPWNDFNGPHGKPTKIRIDRFKKTSTGFVLYRHPPP